MSDRNETVEECARIAESFAVAPQEVTPGTMARNIAKAIRSQLETNSAEQSVMSNIKAAFGLHRPRFR